MKSYEYKGYRIYNNGYGFDIYKNLYNSSNCIISNLESSDECEEYIDELIKDKYIDDIKDVYLVVMLDGYRCGHVQKILHYPNDHFHWFSSSDTKNFAQRTMLKFFDLNQCKNFVDKRYNSSLAVQYGILKAKLVGDTINFRGEQVVYIQKISMK